VGGIFFPEPAVSRILFLCAAETAIIHLVPGSLLRSSGLPKSFGRAILHPFSGMLFYLTLLRVGFALPPLLPMARCALTAPFHPYLDERGGIFSVALSVGSPLPRVTRHTALWSSDFPQPNLGCDCLADSGASILGYF
jgi:hypothetical protein